MNIKSELIYGEGRLRFFLGALLFVICLTVYLVAKEQVIEYGADASQKSFLLTGDAPYYLIATHSIAFDGDLNLYNNIVNKDYRIFTNKTFPATLWLYKGLDAVDRYGPGNPVPEGMRPAKYMRWGYGLPLLLAPAYRLGVYFDSQPRYFVVIFLALLSSVVAVLMYIASLEMTGRAWPAFWAALFFALANPLLPYSHEIFPDVAMAGFMLAAILAIAHTKTRPVLSMVVVTIALAFLPWLHYKVVPLCVLFGIIYFVRIRSFPKMASLFVVVMTLSLLFRQVMNKLAFDSWTPSSGEVGLLTVANGLLGGALAVLFDRDSGGLFYNIPILIFGISGAFLAVKERKSQGKVFRDLTFAFIFVVIWFYVMMAFYKNWQGGASIPLRYAVPIAVFMAPLCAYAVARIDRVWSWALFFGLGIFGIFSSFWSIARPEFYYDLYNHFFHDFFGVGAYSFLPSINWLRYNETPLYDRLLAFAFLLALFWIVSYLVRSAQISEKTEAISNKSQVLRMNVWLVVSAVLITVLIFLFTVNSGFHEEAAKLGLHMGWLILAGWIVMVFSLFAPAALRLTSSKGRFTVALLAILLLSMLFVLERKSRQDNLKSFAVGDTVFHDNSGGNALFGRQWSWPERGWRWTDGPQVDLRIKPDNSFGKDDFYSLSITAGALGTQDIKVAINDSHIGTVTFKDGARQEECLRFSGAVLYPNSLNRIAFVVSNPFQPSEMDRRFLGLSFSQFRIAASDCVKP